MALILLVMSVQCKMMWLARSGRVFQFLESSSYKEELPKDWMSENKKQNVTASS